MINLCDSCEHADGCPDKRDAEQLEQIVVKCRHYEVYHENDRD